MSVLTEGQMSEMLTALLDKMSEEIQALEAALAKADELAKEVGRMEKVPGRMYNAADAYRQARDATR